MELAVLLQAVSLHVMQDLPVLQPRQLLAGEGQQGTYLQLREVHFRLSPAGRSLGHRNAGHLGFAQCWTGTFVVVQRFVCSRYLVVFIVA